MRQFDNICIIGVGLIGGSIALAIKRNGLAKEVVGVFRRRSRMRAALKRKAVDRGTVSIKDGVRGADLIILAAPVHSIPLIAGDAIKYAKKGSIITDVGSTKVWIVRRIEKLLSRGSSLSFVGSHPMAGSERHGVEFAKCDLLDGTPCIVTKTGNTNSASLTKVVEFWSSLGAKVAVMSPASHDAAVSLVSHLPHIVAFSLAGAIPESDMRYAAEGFKDTTRVASSDPRLWADIFLTNREEVIKAGRLFERYYKAIIETLRRRDHSRMVRLLGKAKLKRDRGLSQARTEAVN